MSLGQLPDRTGPYTTTTVIVDITMVYRHSAVEKCRLSLPPAVLIGHRRSVHKLMTGSIKVGCIPFCHALVYAQHGADEKKQTPTFASTSTLNTSRNFISEMERRRNYKLGHQIKKHRDLRIQSIPIFAHWDKFQDMS